MRKIMSRVRPCCSSPRSPLSAQTSSGSIAGTVVDSQQAAVTNATVTLIDPERKTSVAAKTDAEGAICFSAGIAGQVQPHG